MQFESQMVSSIYFLPLQKILKHSLGQILSNLKILNRLTGESILIIMYFYLYEYRQVSHTTLIPFIVKYQIYISQFIQCHV